MLINKTGVLLKIRKSRSFRGIAAMLLLSVFFEMIQPTVSLALTEGPSQPEVQSFEPISTTQMVDPFTGDFNYNIPLFNLPGPNGGYPFNMSYHAGVSPDDEASWVGLGWNINVGSLVRNMRGLPDEFKSGMTNDPTLDEQVWNDLDYIEKKFDMRQNWTAGVGVSKPQEEIFGGNVDPPSQGYSIYYNNYKGIGLSVDFDIYQSTNPSLTMGLSLDSENGLGIDADLSLEDSGKKADLKHKLSISFDGQLSTGYSLTRTRFIKVDGIKHSFEPSTYGSSLTWARNNYVMNVGSKINFHSYSFTLDLQEAFGGTYFGGTLNNGKSYRGFFQTEDYNDSIKKGQKMPILGYSQFGEKNESLGQYILDYNRVNDGQITPNSVVLPSSYYTYDAYMSTGQGLSGYFRGQREDVGKVHDPYVKNETFGTNIELELESAPTASDPTHNHVGVAPGVTSGWNKQGKWDNTSGHNSLSYNFEKNEFVNGIKQMFYYQANGEQTIKDPGAYNHINDFALNTVKLTPKNTDSIAGGKRKIESTGHNAWLKGESTLTDRQVRNTTIHSLTNDESVATGDLENVYHYDYSSSLNAELFSDAPIQLQRNSRSGNNIGHHVGGFKVLNEQGMYYVYGLPTYNHKEVSNLFSAEAPLTNQSTSNIRTKDVVLNSGGSEVAYKQAKTHKFIDKTTKSPYAYSHLLTSVQGADYVDIGNDGPTIDDLGYWVKFDYVKYADKSKWRAPYIKGQFHSGQNYTNEDDKLSYQYGEKEIWYLGRAETKTHIAIFKMSERDDSKEASNEHANAVAGLSSAKSALKLDAIEIYERSTFESLGSLAKPIQTVHFNYKSSNLLCKNTQNSIAPSGGKLTLESVYFTNRNSSRSRNKYTFDYEQMYFQDADNLPTGITETNVNSPSTGNYYQLINPNYSQNNVDPWGQFKDFESTSDYENYVNFPYSNQFFQGWKEHWMGTSFNAIQSENNKKKTKLAADLKASSWCLRKIKLPSGGEIKVDYESDDYGYVQHKTANQMFKITSMGHAQDGNYDELYTGELSPDEDFGGSSTASKQLRRVYFKLETPLEIGQDASDYTDEVYDNYVEPMISDENGEKNLYFKSKMRLVRNPDVYDYVRGYLTLEPKSNENYGYRDDIPTQWIDGVECYTEGFVTIKPAKKKNGSDYFSEYHPMSLAAWTYMQSSASQLLNNPNSASANGFEDDPLNFLIDFINIIPSTASSFGLIRKYCESKNMARFIDLENSGIRLASPDKIKYGGGHRVRAISITDSWSAQAGASESDRTYGQRYEYTVNEDGKTISSGVAQYEPQVGGDENALKYPYYFFAKNSTFTNNNLFSEGPFNEDLYPGASVGYRKVTVRSLNTHNQMKVEEQSSGSGAGRTGGIVEHQFYTSKEFPTFTSHTSLDEQQNTKDIFRLTIPIPLIGAIKRTYYHGTQAFKIELNDMHGKPKSVMTYELNSYQKVNQPITSTEYVYQMTNVDYQDESVYKLDNLVNVIKDDGTHTYSSSNKRVMGAKAEIFTDQRETKSSSNSIGLDFNIEGIYTGIFPSFWPSISNTKTMNRTYVTNKVVQRSGIMRKVISKDLQTSNESEILAYDEKSGIPMLTKITNEFGDNFYDYKIPAYHEYEGMAHAYQNIDYMFKAFLNKRQSPEGTMYEFIPTADQLKHLMRGDELISLGIIGDGDVVANPTSAYQKLYFLGWRQSGGTTLGMLDTEGTFDEAMNGFRVIRSGHRNQFGATIANYLTKGTVNSHFAVQDSMLDAVNGISTPLITDNVLQATATIFAGDWNGSKSQFGGSVYTKNPFRSGTSGIWRVNKSYTYVGERSSNLDWDSDPSIGDVNLYEDGVMSNVPMFTWELGDLENYVSNWEWVSEVTRYSDDAYELENKNRLGIYSSALYGYDNSLTIGVASNAKYNEVGVADFEEVNFSNDGQKNLDKSNLNFIYPTHGQRYISEHYNVISAEIGSSSNTIEVKTDMPASNVMSGYELSSTQLSLKARKTSTNIIKGEQSLFFNGYIQNQNTSTYMLNGVSCYKFEIKGFLNGMHSIDFQFLKTNAEYYGKMGIQKNRTVTSASLLAEAYSSTKAHTGKRSLIIDKSNAYFHQPNINLTAGKKYIVSYWMSRANENARTFEQTGIVPFEIGAYTGTFSALPNNKVTFGKVVEGWQKVDVEFTGPSTSGVLAFHFPMASSSNALYIDDIRISPKIGGVSTYVYDANNFRLLATLNANNYATLFFYDEEGNLHLKKQETEKGIFTVTESRGHVKND